MKKIVIAGASGFIGQHLINSLITKTDYTIIALSRSSKPSVDERLIWKACDLFSVKDIEEAIDGANVAYYLVHSMQPSARLDQASFIDYDLLLADNFGRAAQKKNVSSVIYLSGIIPQTGSLSKHLLSRLEVEEVLKSYFPSFTILRAGLILGREGSSFNILYNLVRRLPIIICPSWGNNETSPVYFRYVIDALVISLMNNDCKNKVYDLGSQDNVSYFKLLQMTAQEVGLKRVFFRFPFNINSISRLWVSFFSGAPKTLVYPLLDSLSHSMRPREEYILPNLLLLDVRSSIHKVVKSMKNYNYLFKKFSVSRKTVRSVQRFTIPSTMNARELANEYMAWLPRFLAPFVRVFIKDNEWITFSVLHPKLKLLILQLSNDRSTDDRVLLYIRGGLLASRQDKGRLEFRTVLNNQWALCAIHEFKPALPWYIYRYTQAILHLFVMKRFGKHVKHLKQGSK